ncbi:MAG: protein-export chaperone SecB [Armatimonadota bacterium]|nr:protein-export chaperone SecB [Armatimonadota bacterium]
MGSSNEVDLVDVVLSEALFRRNAKFERDKSQKIEIPIRFETEILEDMKVNVGVEAGTENDDSTPFFARMRYLASFAGTDPLDDEIIADHAFACVLPFMREVLAEATRRMGYPAFVLPLKINTVCPKCGKKAHISRSHKK